MLLREEVEAAANSRCVRSCRFISQHEVSIPAAHADFDSVSLRLGGSPWRQLPYKSTHISRSLPFSARRVLVWRQAPDACAHIGLPLPSTELRGSIGIVFTAEMLLTRLPMAASSRCARSPQEFAAIGRRTNVSATDRQRVSRNRTQLRLSEWAETMRMTLAPYQFSEQPSRGYTGSV